MNAVWKHSNNFTFTTGEKNWLMVSTMECPNSSLACPFIKISTDYRFSSFGFDFQTKIWLLYAINLCDFGAREVHFDYFWKYLMCLLRGRHNEKKLITRLVSDQNWPNYVIRLKLVALFSDNVLVDIGSKTGSVNILEMGFDGGVNIKKIKTFQSFDR